MCICVQAEVKPEGQAAAELSEAALSELLDQCEDQFAALEKVNSQFNLARLTYPLTLPDLWMWTKLTKVQNSDVCVSVLQLQNEIILCEPDFCENPQEQVSLLYTFNWKL